MSFPPKWKPRTLAPESLHIGDRFRLCNGEFTGSKSDLISLRWRNSMEHAGKSWFTVNVNAFCPPPGQDFPVVPADYEGEDVPARIGRREQKWTPVIALELPGA